MNQEPKVTISSSTSLLNHWKLNHFKAIYELQNGLRKQILLVKNKMFGMCVAYSKLDIGLDL